jgi:antitoxin ChpS
MKIYSDASSVNMKLFIQKWGNSAAIKLPESMLEQLRAKIGDSIEVDVQANTLTLRTVRPRYKLADLLAQTTGSFPAVDGWDEMSPVGKEIF